MSRDLRAQMHPAVASGIELTPEHVAIVHRRNAPFLTFGHLVTRLADEGIISPTSPEDVREQVGSLFDMEATLVEQYMDHPADLPTTTRDDFRASAQRTYETLFVDAVEVMARQRTSEIVAGIVTDAEGYQELLDHQQQRVESLATENSLSAPLRLKAATRRLRELEKEPWAISLTNFGHAAQTLGSDLGPEAAEWYCSEVNAAVADSVELREFMIPIWEQELAPESIDFRAVAGANVVDDLPKAYAHSLGVDPAVREVIQTRVNTIEDIMFISPDQRQRFRDTYPLQ